ncbi:MAG: M1 family peptidase [Nitrospirae bacterium]|nr:M1 family peptidase [Nitrospirota bacterium]
MRIAPLLAALLWAAPALAMGPVRHDISAELVPPLGTLRVTDRVTLPDDALPAPDGTIAFTLHGALKVTGGRPAVARGELRAGTADDPVPQRRHTVPMPADRVLTLTYSGSVRHAVTDGGGTPGLIDPEGALLSGTSHWYPQFGTEMVTFSVTVTTPPGWRAVSQGARTAAAVTDGKATVTWTEDHPQDEIHLVAGPLTEFNLPGSSPVSQVFLRTPPEGAADQELADRYLTATALYLDLYADLLGPYPYAKFALVENFWETGYGMPSFTLLGPTVIRLPFIADTSYPHEILHNWWGNGVFVQENGNWAEGLTAYLADHELKARHGQGAEYRRDALTGFWDYVKAGNDTTLVDFRARHDRASQAVGYGKGMMLFHMLRAQLGDAAFFAGLRDLYLTRRFTRAGYDDIARALGHASGRDLRPEFQQWTRRLGGPALAVSEVAAETADGKHQLRFTLAQTQPGPPYILYVPVRIAVDGQEAPVARTVRLSRPRQTVTLPLPGRPTHLSVDPEFDVFRKPDPAEIPPALSGLFGAETPLFVLPAAAPAPLQEAYRALAMAWDSPPERIVLDSTIDALPGGAAVWVLGWDNRFVPQAGNALVAQGNALLLADGVVFAEGVLGSAGHAVAFTATDGARDGAPLGWIGAATPEQLAALARKLPHYGQYGYVAFRAAGMESVLKGRWQGGEGPLSVPVP